MPARSKITMLPEEIKAEVNRRLIAGSFADYAALAEWLQEQGFEISRSAIHRYGQEFEAKCEAIKIATEQAKAIVGVVGDDEGNMALIRLIQQLSFDILVKSQDGDLGDILPKMGVMVAKLSKASVDQKKWQRDIKEKAVQAVRNIETKATTGKKSLDPETMKIIKEEIYGIV
jgi:hypothetical protein